MMFWQENPSADLVRVFGGIAATRMAGLPICHPRLQVEALGFRRMAEGHWAGVIVTPWAINLLCLPGHTAWPDLPVCSKHCWRFPSGDYEFIVAEEDSLGRYHLCSLFSPVLEFEDQEQARLTALASAHALFADPLRAVEPKTAPSRRAFLGLGR